MDAKHKINQYSEAALHLEAIINTATDGIIVIDERGIMEMINNAAAQLFHYEIDELLGSNVSMLMEEPYHSEHDSYIRNYKETGVRKIIGIGREVKGKRKNGTIFPFRLSISEVKLKDRRIFTGIVHDLTKEKKAEKNLREEKEKAQMYLDVANTVFVVINKEGNVSLLNEKGCEILGYQEEEVLGKNWFDLVIPVENREKVRAEFGRLMRGFETVANDYFENVILTKSGAQRLVAWRNAVIKDEKGKNTATVSSGVDITEQRAAEDSIKRLNAELEERVEIRTEELADAVNQLLNINKQMEYEIHERKLAEEALRKNERELRKAYETEKELNELKTRFVSMASHEFRTPLSTILSSADIIEAYTETDQQARREKHTNRIKSAVANLTGILNDFLSLSRLEEGKLQSDPIAFAPDLFCQEVIEELQGLLKKDQHIRCHFTGKVPSVYLDKKFLKNIMFNLLSNAIKYSDPGEPVDLHMEVNEHFFELTVIDYGIGIPDGEQQHLFTRFFRAHNVENIQGTGLGLNIVRRYVDLMDGSISFESKLGEGTTFRVQIPIPHQ